MRRRFSPAFDGVKLAGLILVLLLLARLAWRWGEPAAPLSLTEGRYPLARVIDGDTLLLANGARIRLIGVDSPETVKPHQAVQPWGPEASAFTRQFVGDGPVELRFDRERVDRHGRFLAYVSVDGRMLNEELLRAGLAEARLGYNYSDSVKRRYRAAQKEAQAAQRGMWSQKRSSSVEGQEEELAHDERPSDSSDDQREVDEAP